MKCFNFILTIAAIIGLVWHSINADKEQTELQDVVASQGAAIEVLTNKIDGLTNELDNLTNEVENNRWTGGPIYVVNEETKEEPIEKKTAWVKPSNYHIIPYYPE